MPEYLSNTTERVSTDSFYWSNRLIAALADARFHENAAHIERYQEKIGGIGHRMLRETDAACRDMEPQAIPAALARANEDMVATLRDQTDALLGRVLHQTSLAMKNAVAMSDN